MSAEAEHHPQPPPRPPWAALRRFAPLVFLPLLALYYIAAKGNGETKNHDVYDNDQKVYLNTAQNIAHDPGGYFTPRQRTPGYPYFLSLFYDDAFDVPEGSKPPFDLAWFERGKSINLHLSLFLLAGLFLFCRLYLPFVESGIIAVGSGLLLYTFKAYYVQPELTYWTLNTILFVLLGRMLFSPSWRLAVTCGVLSAVTYFVKAGTQPLLLLFAVTWGIKVLWDAWIGRREPGPARSALTALGQGASVIAIYLLLMTPYFVGTARKFDGKPFYSVYTEYMMWLPMDARSDDFSVDRDHMWGFYYAGARNHPITVEQFNASYERAVRERLRREAEKAGWPEEKLEKKVAQQFQPVTELANARQYFERYPVAHSIDRVKHGFTMLEKRIKKYYKRAEGLVSFTFKVAAAGLALRLLWGALARSGRWPGRLRLAHRGDPALPEFLKRRPYALFYVAGFFIGYAVLYAWYDALGIGPRLFLSLYVPLLFVAVWSTHHLFRPLEIELPKLRLRLSLVANILLVIMLAYLSHRLMTGELYEHMNTGG